VLELWHRAFTGGRAKSEEPLADPALQFSVESSK
jgi:hypothetical protein